MRALVLIGLCFVCYGSVTPADEDNQRAHVRGLSSEALCGQLHSGSTLERELLQEIHHRTISCGDLGDLGGIDYTPDYSSGPPLASPGSSENGDTLLPVPPQEMASDSPSTSVPSSPRAPLPNPSSNTLEATVVRVSTPRAAGSGFYLDPTHVVTNAHVVDTTPWVDLALSGGTPFKGQVIYRNPDLDFAIIQSQTLGVPGVMRRSPLMQGEVVAALGYPQGRTILATSTGTIRDLDACCILHDALIAGGSSGGPLLDGAHQVLGLNTLISKRPGDDTNRYDRGVALRLDFIARMILESTSTSLPTPRH